MLEFKKDMGLSVKDKATKDKAMSDVFYAQNLFKEAFPERRYGSVKEMLNAAYSFMSRRVQKDFTHRRARSIWEATAHRIDGEEIDVLRLAIIEENKREQYELRARLAALDARLANIDEAFHSETLAALRSSESWRGK